MNSSHNTHKLYLKRYTIPNRDKIHYTRQTDYGQKPYVVNVEQVSLQNRYFRSAVWTGRHMQMTVMRIPPCGEIGLEIHEETDQFIRVEQGCALVKMGECKRELDFQQNMHRRIIQEAQYTFPKRMLKGKNIDIADGYEYLVLCNYSICGTILKK